MASFLGSARGLTTTAAAATATPAEAVSVGDTIFAAVQTFTLTSGIVAGNMTDTKGNTWTLVSAQGTFSSTDGQTALWVCQVATGAAAAGFTVSFTPPSSTFASLVVEHFSGGTATQDSSTATATGTGNPATVTTTFGSTTTDATDILIAICGNGNATSSQTYTTPTGWTLPTNGRNDSTNSNTECLAMVYQIVSATGTYATAQKWTSDNGANTWHGIMAAFQQGGGGGATDPFPLAYRDPYTDIRSNAIYRM